MGSEATDTEKEADLTTNGYVYNSSVPIVKDVQDLEIQVECIDLYDSLKDNFDEMSNSPEEKICYKEAHASNITCYESRTLAKQDKGEYHKTRSMKKSSSLVKSSSKKSSPSGAQSTTSVGSPPLALAADKRTPRSNVCNSPYSSMIKMPNSSISRKSMPPYISNRLEEEDTCSIASSTAMSVKSTRVRSTVPYAPVFRCTERAEKRKEFYTKLEERQQAMEAERSQSEERTKEEREAALKQLRKSMAFKATPMPSFYQEGPPPKAEIKKIPLTRPKSPKLGRRKSSGDAASSVNDKNGSGCCRLERHSLESYRDDAKGQMCVRKENALCKDKDLAKSTRENSKLHTFKISGQRNSDITVQ